METFKKRQKEMRRLERQRDKPPNAWKSRLARPAVSQAGQMPISQQPKTPRHPTPRQLHRRSSMARKGNLAEVRYLGFHQRGNSRVYRFGVQTDGRLTKEVSVTADMVVLRDHRVGIQEGPFLSGNKLTADLGRGWEGEHELTAADLRAHADAKARADAERGSARKAPRRRPGVPAALTQQKSPWRHFGI